MVLCILVFLLPSNNDSPLLFGLKPENISGSCMPAVCQNEAKIEPNNLHIVNGNSLEAVSAPEVLKMKTLATLDYEEALISQPRKEVTEYTVEDGDSIVSVAKKFGISEQTVYWANNMAKGAKIKSGQSLIILPVDGVIYFVKEGDSLQKIAKNTNSDSKEISAFNELDNDKVYPGDILIVPGGKFSSPAKAKSYAIPVGSGEKALPDNYFICPIPRMNGICKITQGLHFMNAVDFSSGLYCCGQPVYAASSGIVYKVKTGGYNSGYGNYVKIKHPSGLTTLYAHLQNVYVKEGQEVANGETIGTIGNTGRTIGVTGCHLHFEVGSLNGNAPKNPFAH